MITHLDIAVTRYDNTRPLFDGSAAFDGLDATPHSPNIPEIFAGSRRPCPPGSRRIPNIAPLFADHEARERDWYRRTGIFPMMHTVAMRRELVEANPGLATSLYRGFLAAKDVAADLYRDRRRLFQVTPMVPWMHDLVEENRTIFPDDWFPYGVETNRHALETFVRYSGEQGLTRAPSTVDELFIADLRPASRTSRGRDRSARRAPAPRSRPSRRRTARSRRPRRSRRSATASRTSG